MKIVEVEKRDYALVYEDKQGNGYSFHCDKHGAILWGKISSPTAAKKNLAYCKEHQEKWNGRNGEVVTLISRERYGICPRCGRRVYFGGSGWAAYIGTAECECGQWYNVFGQALKPPEDWEEEEDY